MEIDAQGMLVGGEYIPSPNCDDRPDGEIGLLVIHNISLPPGEFGGDAVQQLFTNALEACGHPSYQGIANLKVSAHFFIRRNGEITQFVPCSKRAWHAGMSCWQGKKCCNDFSIGIELEGCDTAPFTDAQYLALTHLTLALRSRYPACGITGHSNIAPLRKTDPGPYFDWQRYLTGLCRT